MGETSSRKDQNTEIYSGRTIVINLQRPKSNGVTRGPNN